MLWDWRQYTPGRSFVLCKTDSHHISRAALIESLLQWKDLSTREYLILNEADTLIDVREFFPQLLIVLSSDSHYPAQELTSKKSTQLNSGKKCQDPPKWVEAFFHFLAVRHLREAPEVKCRTNTEIRMGVFHFLSLKCSTSYLCR